MIQYYIWWDDGRYTAAQHPSFSPTSNINEAYQWREKRHKEYPNYTYEVREYKPGELQ